MLDPPYSLVDGVVSPIIPLATSSDDRPQIGEFVSNDDLHKYQKIMKGTAITGSSRRHDVTEARAHTKHIFAIPSPIFFGIFR